MTEIAAIPNDRSAGASCAAGAGSGVQLNTFQQLMRRWNTVAPYSAGQVMQVSGAGDVERWRAAAEGVIAEMGLGRPEFDATGAGVRFVPLPFLSIDHATGDLAAYTSTELNRPFGPEELPIRFFILPRPQDNTHYFGAIYDHWIADSRAMRELMERIFRRYQTPGRPAELPPLTVASPDFRTLFGHITGPFHRLQSIRQGLRTLVRHCRAYRVNLRDPLDFSAQVLYRRLPDGLIERVHRYAKSHGGSVNDAFLAVLAQTMGAFTAGLRYRPRKKRFHIQRNRVGLGTIVDIRDAAREPLDRVFGVFLSNYTVVLPKPEEAALPGLVTSIGKMTRKIKRHHQTVRAFLALNMARYWWDWHPKTRNKALLLHKNTPVVAGISNVNLTGSWVDGSESRQQNGDGMPVVLDYLRISPAGPLLPLVFTLTTIGDRLSLCVTHRTTAFTPAEAEALMSDFVRRLDEAMR